jgi:hypothetical protein
MIVDALGGSPINDLIEGWFIRIDEITPYVFRAEGKDSNGRTLLGVGGSAEDALDDCIKKIERNIQIQNKLLGIRNKITEIFNFRK